MSEKFELYEVKFNGVLKELVGRYENLESATERAKELIILCGVEKENIEIHTPQGIYKAK